MTNALAIDSLCFSPPDSLIPFSPIILGGIGSIFMLLHNSKIKESNNKVYEIFKFSLFAVLISDEIIDESELEYSSSNHNTVHPPSTGMSAPVI